MAQENGQRVCVTGAGGFVASWLIKLLLSHGYSVHGTLRNPEDHKHDHLKALENAAEKLTLFKADVLDYDSILAAAQGCNGVVHVASPVPNPSTLLNPEEDLLKPTVNGTLNVLKACSEAKAKRVVIVSSISAITMNPDWPKDQEMDESCWSDAEYCKAEENWYCHAKTVAEAEAFKYAKRNELNLISVCPALVIGPMLQRTLNTSNSILVMLMKGMCKEMENNLRKLVDVRDVAEALKLVYEKPEAEGRYICLGHLVKAKELVEMVKEMYPDYDYPMSFKEGRDELRLSSAKLERLGWKYRPLKETLVDSVENYKEAGLLK